MNTIPAVRIWPMSDKLRGFRGKSIAQHVKQALNPTLYAKFRRRTKGVNG